MTQEIEDGLVTFVEELAREAGALAREKFGTKLEIDHKGFRDIVTEADYAAQRIITDRVRDRYPEHGFVTEEEDAELPGVQAINWLIDPIDGTTNYSRRHPLFCVSVAVARGGDPRHERSEVLAGVIYDPMRDEMFSATLGGGATLNGDSMQVSDIASLGERIIAVDWSRHRRLRQSTLDVVVNLAHEVTNVRAIGSAALAMAWVAAGRYDGYVNFNLNPWDVAAADLLVREAGGALSDAQGGPLNWSVKGASVVATNGPIHEGLIDGIGLR